MTRGGKIKPNEHIRDSIRKEEEDGGVSGKDEMTPREPSWGTPQIPFSKAGANRNDVSSIEVMLLLASIFTLVE
jgi:hypothetical protein